MEVERSNRSPRAIFSKLTIFMEYLWNMNDKIPFPFVEDEHVTNAVLISGQSEWELKELLTLVYNELKPAITIELGIFDGGTTYLLSLVTKDMTIGVDLIPKYSENLPKSNVEIIQGSTHNEETFNNVKQKLNGRKCDLLFIDADHTYESVKKDYEIWSELVRSGGWIVFHDIDPNHVNDDICQVNKFWKEISGNKIEFIATEEHRAMGYGGIPIHYGGIGILKNNS